MLVHGNAHQTHPSHANQKRSTCVDGGDVTAHLQASGKTYGVWASANACFAWPNRCLNFSTVTVGVRWLPTCPPHLVAERFSAEFLATGLGNRASASWLLAARVLLAK